MLIFTISNFIILQLLVKEECALLDGNILSVCRFIKLDYDSTQKW